MLTTAQKATLKTNILATPEANTLYTEGNLAGLADYYNVTASPDFWVWKTSVTKAHLTQSTSSDGTSFTWVGNGFITRSAGEQVAWQELFDETGAVNPALPNVRQAFSDIFSGPGNAAANRTHLLIVARRLATRFEKVFATGTGSTASPATMVVEGPLDYTELIGL